MMKIDKGCEPAAWRKYRLTPGATYQAIPALVGSLLDEQGYVCAYCECRITAARDAHRVEHVKCRKRYPELQLDYQNMVACCSGNMRGLSHCDRSKGDRDISFTPIDTRVADSIFYENSGTIKSRNSLWDDEFNHVLNLNLSIIKSNRRKTLMGVIAELNRRKVLWRKGDIERMIEKWESRHPRSINGQRWSEYYPYRGIVIYYLKKKLHQME